MANAKGQRVWVSAEQLQWLYRAVNEPFNPDATTDEITELINKAIAKAIGMNAIQSLSSPLNSLPGTLGNSQPGASEEKTNSQFHTEPEPEESTGYELVASDLDCF